MSTLTAPRTLDLLPHGTSGRQPARSARSARQSFTGTMRGEWIKLLSLRSTWWTMGMTVVVIALFALGQAISLTVMADSPETAPLLEVMHGAEVISAGYPFGMISIVVLGTLLITGEYSTGMIRSTFAAVPTRLPVLAAKAVALVVLTTAVGALSLAVSYLATAPMLAEHGLVPSLRDADTWQVLGGTVFFLVAAALFSLALGTLLRATAGAVTVSLTVLLLLPGLLQMIRLDWVQDVVSYLPTPAATAFLRVSEGLGPQSELSSWAGVLVLTAYALLPLAAAAVAMRRRDA